MELPEKVTTYGGPDDSFIRCEDNYSKEEHEDGTCTIHINRTLFLKRPVEYLTVNLKVG